MQASFKVGDTVDTKSGTSGIVTAAWMSNGKQKMNVKTSMKTPPLTYAAHEVTMHVLQSPDMVLVPDERGIVWALEICDVNVSGTAFYFMNDGDLMMHPVSEIIQVIPASLARVHAVMGA